MLDMLYIIPVAFNDFLPSLIYHHFLYFHVAMKLLVNPQLYKQYVKYANQLLIKFIRDSIQIYGKKFVVYVYAQLSSSTGGCIEILLCRQFFSFSI